MNERREFKYTEEEAEIVARCELGIYDLPRRMTFLLVAVILIVIAARFALRLPLPSFAALESYMVCVAAWILFLLFLRYRLIRTKKDLMARNLILYFGDKGIEIYETAEFREFRCLMTDVTRLERGDRICRIDSKAGRICFPLRLLSAQELQMLDALETADHVRKDWM